MARCPLRAHRRRALRHRPDRPHSRAERHPCPSPMSDPRRPGLLRRPARTAMLSALPGDQALPAGELARRPGVHPATATAHLRRLVQGGPVQVRVQGRHRCHELAGPKSPSCSKRSPGSPRPSRFAPYGTTTVLPTRPRPGPVTTTLAVDAASNYSGGCLRATLSAPVTTATTFSPTAVASWSPSWAPIPTTSKAPDEYPPAPASTGPPAARTWPGHYPLSSLAGSSPSDGCRVPEPEPSCGTRLLPAHR